MRVTKLHLASAAWYLAAVAAVALPWFLAPGYLFFTDFVFGPHTPIRWAQNGAPLVAALRFLSLALPASLVQKCFLASLVAALLLAGERLARAFVDDRWLARVVSLFFVFNPFVYDRMGYGQVTVVLGLAFATLALGELVRLERPDAWKRFLRAGIWFGLAVQMSPHFAFIGGLVGAAWLVATLTNKAFRTRRFFLALAIIPCAAFLLNANWIFRVGHSGGTMVPIATTQDYSAFQTSGDTGAGALGNVLMLSGFWGKDQGRYADLTAFRENWGRSFFVLLAVMAVGFRSAWHDPKRRPLAAALVAAALVAAFLAVGVRLPVAREVSLWMFAHVPGYNGMRETQKWAAAEVIAYGTLLAWGMARIFQTKRVRDNRRVTLVVSAGVIVLFAPLLLWGMNGTAKPVEYPDDWNALSASLKESGCPGTTLFLPWHMYMGFSWIGRVVANPAEEFFPCGVLQGTNMEWKGIYDNSGSTKGAAVEAWLRSGGTDAASLAPYDVRRVILAKDSDWAEYAWLDARPEWRLVSDTATLRVYELVP